MTLIEPIGFLRDQAIRMRRVKWPSAWMLADELWLILSALEPPGTGKMTVNPSPDTTDNYTLPSLPALYIPPLDLDIPDAGTYQPDNQQHDTGGQYQQTAETCFWHRSVMPGLITSLPAENAGDTVCGVTLYPNGFLGNQCVNKWRHDPEEALRVEDEATCLGEVDEVEVGDYVLVFHVAQWAQKETTLRDKNTMAIIAQETELTRLQYQQLFTPPGGGGGGTVAITTGISALSGMTPGSGSMQRYKLNPDSGQLETYGQPVTVYSSVRVAVEAGKRIQAKKIDGRWWVDVEDCRDNEAGY